MVGTVGIGGCRAVGTVRWVRCGYGTGTVWVRYSGHFLFLRYGYGGYGTVRTVRVRWVRYCGRGKNGNPSVPTRAELSETMFSIALEI